MNTRKAAAGFLLGPTLLEFTEFEVVGVVNLKATAIDSLSKRGNMVQ